MVDYLIGSSSKMVFDKKILKHMEDIENLPEEEKKKVYDLLIWLSFTIKQNRLLQNKPPTTSAVLQ
jgi:hypothetical protein